MAALKTHFLGGLNETTIWIFHVIYVIMTLGTALPKELTVPVKSYHSVPIWQSSIAPLFRCRIRYFEFDNLYVEDIFEMRIYIIYVVDHFIFFTDVLNIGFVLAIVDSAMYRSLVQNCNRKITPILRDHMPGFFKLIYECISLLFYMKKASIENYKGHIENLWCSKSTFSITINSL